MESLELSNEASLNALGADELPDLTELSEEADQSARFDYAAKAYLAGASLEDIKIALKDKTYIDPKTKLPTYLHEFLPLFDPVAAEKLPPRRDCDHKIELKEGATPPFGPLYQMSVDELQVLRKYLKEQLDKGYIRASKSPAASPVLFAKKPGGGLRFCVDYRALNAITIKNRYPLPLVQETLSKLSEAKFYTKLDVIAAFNAIRVAEGDEWLTAFNTRYGLFESLVMPFGLSNAPATWQAEINRILRPYLDIFCTAYMDDILIYSDTIEEHRQHTKLVLEAIRSAGFFLDIKKCEFEVTEVTYLGMIVSTEGCKMDPKKVSAITEWVSPGEDTGGGVKGVQSFLGFTNFYRRFIKNFSKIVRPLVALTKKDVKFQWSGACEKAFQKLKSAFVTAPILRHYDPTKETVVECDASDYVCSGILSQYDEDGVLHPVAFMSKKLLPAECNYEIYDKELLAIVRCFEDWRAELMGVDKPITVLTDHRNLQYFMTTRQLNRREARWAGQLAPFDFTIVPRPGKLNVTADALTRRPQDLPYDNKDERIAFNNQALLKPHNLDPRILAEAQEAVQRGQTMLCPLGPDEEILTPQDHIIEKLLEEGYAEKNGEKVDALWSRVYKEMTKERGTPSSKEIALAECEIIQDRLYFRDRLYVPDVIMEDGTPFRTYLLQAVHDSCESGHPGKNKMYEAISRYYFWPNLSKDCTQFVKNCDVCMRNNTSRSKYQGTLKPLPIPLQRWRNISIDFIGPIVESNGYNCVMVVVDMLSKMRHYIPCHTTTSTEDLAWLFIKHVWRYRGFPDSITSDRGSAFTSEFWRALCHRLQINVSFSTAYHPETDGQTEQANAFLEQYLRKYIDFSQENWEEWLPMAEFAANNAVNVSTQMSPFFANYGYHPRVSFGPPRLVDKSSSAKIKRESRAGADFATKMEEVLSELRANLTVAKDKQEQFANANRKPSPAYKVGDWVFLDMRNITSSRPTEKLSEKWSGRYKITKKVNSHAYKLALPFEHERKHDVFHVTHLRPAPHNPLPGQRQAPAPPIAIDETGQKLWGIEAITNSKRQGGQFWYYITWRGDEEAQTWEPLVNVVNSHAARELYKKAFPKKPHPRKAEVDKARKQLEAEARQREEGKDDVDSEGEEEG